MLEVNENPQGSGTMPIRIRVYNNPPGNPARAGYVSVRHHRFPPHLITVRQAGWSEVLYYHTDAIGSVRMITDERGAVRARYDYLPFGEVFEFNPQAFRDPRMFAGTERDPVTENDYLSARYYQAPLGRFLRPDDPGYADPYDPQSMNLYGDAFNNPLWYVDPEGHSGDCIGGYDATTGTGEAVDYIGLVRFFLDRWLRPSFEGNGSPRVYPAAAGARSRHSAEGFGSRSQSALGQRRAVLQNPQCGAFFGSQGSATWTLR